MFIMVFLFWAGLGNYYEAFVVSLTCTFLTLMNCGSNSSPVPKVHTFFASNNFVNL